MGVYSRRPTYFGEMRVTGLSLPEEGAEGRAEITQGEREGKSVLAEGKVGVKFLK